MAFNIFLCVILGFSVQCVMGTCDNATITDAQKLLEPLFMPNTYHNFTEAHTIICSDKMQQNLVKGASKLEPCLDVYLYNQDRLLRGLAIPYVRRVLQKVSQPYMTDVCRTFKGVLPHMECIWNMLMSLQNKSELMQSLSTCLWTRPSEEPCSIINVVVDVSATCILDIIDEECPKAKDAAPAFLDAVLKIMPRDCAPRQEKNAVDAVMRSRLVAMVIGILIPAWI